MVVQSRVLSVGEHKEEDMDKELREGMQLLYCKWCPQDCQGLTKEEKLGCLASGGYVDDELPILHSQGVLVRVEKECSHCKGEGFTDQVKNGNSTVCQICLGDRSIIEFESLIE